MSKNNILCILPFLFGAVTAMAQRGYVAAGGVASGSGGSVTYSAGQIDYLNVTGSGILVAEGLQHPFEYYLVTEIEDPQGRFEISVYPNPTEDYLIIDADLSRAHDLGYTLRDIQGKLLLQGTLSTAETRISIKGFTQATYFLSIAKGKTQVTSFKIIKIQ